jgi:hypothetical protein
MYKNLNSGALDCAPSLSLAKITHPDNPGEVSALLWLPSVLLTFTIAALHPTAGGSSQQHLALARVGTFLCRWRRSILPRQAPSH